jgi:hypothetical protein
LVILAGFAADRYKKRQEANRQLAANR